MRWFRALLALAVLPFLLAAAPSVANIAEALSRCDGATDDRQVGGYLEALGRMGPAAAPAAVPVILRQLSERSLLWRDRDKTQVVRLRGFLLATLARLGPPEEALAPILAELSGAKHPYSLAAAARAAGALGPRAAAAVPYLQRPLDPGFHDEPMSLERYDPDFPPEERTTARLEAVRALARIQTQTLTPRPPLPTPPPSLTGRGGDQQEATPWLAPERRPEIPSLDLPAVDQDDQAVNLKGLADRPMVLSFFYARCDNPNRCSLVTSTLARLQRDLDAAALGGRVRVVLATFEPEADTPAVLKRYGLDRGFRFGEGARILRPDPVREGKLLDALRSPVNFSAGWVNVHGIALHLFDRRGRYVRTYHTVLWDNAAVLADLRRLAEEG
jgi:protein SCO1/2